MFDKAKRSSPIAPIDFPFAGEGSSRQFGFELRTNSELGPVEFAVGGKARSPGEADYCAGSWDGP